MSEILLSYVSVTTYEQIVYPSLLMRHRSRCHVWICLPCMKKVFGVHSTQRLRQTNINWLIWQRNSRVIWHICAGSALYRFDSVPHPNRFSSAALASITRSTRTSGAVKQIGQALGQRRDHKAVLPFESMILLKRLRLPNTMKTSSWDSLHVKATNSKCWLATTADSNLHPMVHVTNQSIEPMFSNL